MHEKERENTTNDRWHGGSAENMVAHLSESVETIAALKKRRVNTVVDSGCA